MELIVSYLITHLFTATWIREGKLRGHSADVTRGLSRN